MPLLPVAMNALLSRGGPPGLSKNERRCCLVSPRGLLPNSLGKSMAGLGGVTQVWDDSRAESEGAIPGKVAKKASKASTASTRLSAFGGVFVVYSLS